MCGGGGWGVEGALNAILWTSLIVQTFIKPLTYSRSRLILSSAELL